MDSAKAKRDEGAALFQQSNYAAALPKFVEGAALLSTVNESTDGRQVLLISCLLNTASCCVKLGQNEEAIRTATEVIGYDRKNCKAYFRRGQANMNLKQYSKARIDLMIASELSAGSDQSEAIVEELKRLREAEAALKASGGAAAPSSARTGATGSSTSSTPSADDLYKQMMKSLGKGAPYDEAPPQRFQVPAAASSSQQQTAAAPSGPAVIPPGLEELKAAADAGDVNAMLTLGDHFENGTGGAKKHPAECFRLYKQAADTGDAKALSYAAWCFKTGFGTPVNLPEAINLYKAAAAKGLVKAQACLGYLYEKGEGVAPNAAEAVRFYTQAAEQGDATSQVNLGLLYEKGVGVEKDFALALKWFTAAAEQGNLSACINAGVAYEKGQGTQKDMTVAFSWYNRAAKAGDHTAQAILACCYEKGLGVAADTTAALSWYEKSARQGNPHAREGLKRLLNVQ